MSDTSAYRFISNSTSTTAPRFVFPRDPMRQREAEICTCGLVDVGYVSSWAVEHSNKCPAKGITRWWKTAGE